MMRNVDIGSAVPKLRFPPEGESRRGPTTPPNATQCALGGPASAP